VGGSGERDEAATSDVSVSVLVCTRNRPESLERALRSLLASEDVVFELVVVDQSNGDATRRLIDGIDDCRVRYHRSNTRGLGAALARGVAVARSQFIVRIDDDCEVEPYWVAQMAKSLRDHAAAGMVCSNVVAAPFDAAAGYVPTLERNADHLTRSILGTARLHGLGAGVAYRRDALDGIGGFDPALGSGSQFRSSEDWDTQLRMLLRGWFVFHDASLEVTHHGFRSFADGREHARNSWFGIGAMFSKLVRVGPPSLWLLATWKFAADAVVPPFLDVLHLHRPRGIGRVRAFCRGFVLAFRVPVDRKTMRFVTSADGGKQRRSRD
jgi:glycosyltransferase involved in cell wall biosynthesis